MKALEALETRHEKRSKHHEQIKIGTKVAMSENRVKAIQALETKKKIIEQGGFKEMDRKTDLKRERDRKKQKERKKGKKNNMCPRRKKERKKEGKKKKRGKKERREERKEEGK